MSFTTVTALAKDNNFRIVIILAGTKNNLLHQTTSRLRDDLSAQTTNARKYKILENPDKKDILLIGRTLKQRQKPLIILTLLKHSGRIDKLTEIFSDPQIKINLGSEPTLIIDDEADQASLNTLARRNARNDTDDESRTFEAIINLRNSLINHTFLQYTATPQGPLLIDIMSILSPDFHVVLSPGEKYTGGEKFFNEYRNELIVRIPDDEVFHNTRNPLTKPPKSLISALQDFYIGAAIQIDLLENAPMLSMMVHPDVRRNASQLFKTWIEEIVEKWIENFELNENDPIKTAFFTSFEKRIKTSLQILDKTHLQLNEVLDSIYDCLLDTKIHLVIGGNAEVEWSLGTCHILVGGAKLDRGFTVKGLMTTYMPRHSISISNADTIQQRCRFFGYKKKFLKSCRVYLPLESIQEYTNYIEHEEHLRSVLKTQSTEEFSRTFLLDRSLRPTRTNILTSDLLRRTLDKSKQTNATTNINHNTNIVELILNKYNRLMDENKFDYSTDDRCHRITKIPIDEAIEFLLNFKMTSVEDMNLKSLTIEYLLYHKDQNSITTCNLIEMAFKRKEDPRVRTIVSSERIKNIFSGRSTTGAGVYPGDKAICEDDSLSIQIHRIKLRNETFPLLHDKIIYTLGLIYPNDLRLSFVGNM